MRGEVSALLLLFNGSRVDYSALPGLFSLARSAKYTIRLRGLALNILY